jgi:hypothetical protein
MHNKETKEIKVSKLVLDMVLQTSLWKGVVDNMYSKIRSCKEVEEISYAFIEETVCPLEDQIVKWSSDNASVCVYLSHT